MDISKDEFKEQFVKFIEEYENKQHRPNWHNVATLLSQATMFLEQSKTIQQTKLHSDVMIKSHLRKCSEKYFKKAVELAQTLDQENFELLCDVQGHNIGAYTFQDLRTGKEACENSCFIKVESH
jgi:stalled ribosome rescue protein Dom34